MNPLTFGYARTVLRIKLLHGRLLSPKVPSGASVKPVSVRVSEVYEAKRRMLCRACCIDDTNDAVLFVVIPAVHLRKHESPRGNVVDHIRRTGPSRATSVQWYLEREL